MPRRKKVPIQERLVSGLCIGLTLVLLVVAARRTIATGVTVLAVAGQANVSAAADSIAPSNVNDLRSASEQGSVGPCLPAMVQPTIATIGVTIATPLPAATTSAIRYRTAHDGAWQTGPDGVKINTGAITSSIFWLSPNTSYDVEASTRDSAGTILTTNRCTVTTQPDVLPNTSTRTLYVSAAAAPGGNGTIGQPYKTIQAAVNVSQAGDIIQVASGTYHESLSFPRSGAAGAFITLRGDPGAIVNGSEPTIEQNGLTWTPDGTYPNVYSASLVATPLAAAYMPGKPVWRDADHFYTFDSLAGLQSGTGHGNVPMAEGWFVDQATHVMYVRSLTSPSTHTWHIPVQDFGIPLSSRDHIWIEGLQIRYFDIGIYVRSSSNIVIRDSSFQTKTGILMDASGGTVPTDNRIEGNTFIDGPLADWGYAAVKGTAMETAAITSWQGDRNIIRDNRIEQYHDGIFTGDAGETDIYHNYIRHLSDDGLELDGAANNLRAWGNVVDDVLSSVSLAPVDVGPAWIMYNRLTQFTGRAFKIGGGVDSTSYLYHNTAWSNRTGAFGTQQVTSDSSRIIFRNNILQGDPAIRWTVVMPGLDMDYDNAYSTGVQPYYWNAVYTQLSSICTVEHQECHGSQAIPGLSNPAGGDFRLGVGSSNIDSAVRLPGINDTFTGAAPDRGYIEFGQTELQW